VGTSRSVLLASLALCGGCGDDASRSAAIAEQLPELASDAGDAGEPPESRATFNVWQWNVAGHKMHAGSTTDGLIEAAVQSIVGRGAHFVAFNELCRSQYDALMRALRSAGWPADPNNFARFSEGRPGGTSICNGTAFGNAVFSKAPLGAADALTLADDGISKRTLVCAPLAEQQHVRFCTTHITTANEVADDGVPKNVRQLRDVLARLEDYHARGDTVLIAGDFNAQPNYGRLNSFYSTKVVHSNNPNNVGHYRELDDDDAEHCPGYGEATIENAVAESPCGTPKKIDFIFVREDRIAGSYEEDALAISGACGGNCSDHRIVFGRVPVFIRPR
jgi:endonuclease/exonuclease/phosphatase family metal-dependent hydrolase